MTPVDIAVIVIVSVAFAAAAGFLIYRRFIKKKKGCDCGCDCGCKSCPSCDACRAKEDKKQ